MYYKTKRGATALSFQFTGSVIDANTWILNQYKSLSQIYNMYLQERVIELDTNGSLFVRPFYPGCTTINRSSVPMGCWLVFTLYAKNFSFASVGDDFFKRNYIKPVEVKM